MTPPPTLYHGWFRPHRRHRQRRKLWVRVTPAPCATRDEAIEFAHRRADLEGGGDVWAGYAWENPNDKVM